MSSGSSAPRCDSIKAARVSLPGRLGISCCGNDTRAHVGVEVGECRTRWRPQRKVRRETTRPAARAAVGRASPCGWSQLGGTFGLTDKETNPNSAGPLVCRCPTCTLPPSACLVHCCNPPCVGSRELYVVRPYPAICSDTRHVAPSRTGSVMLAVAARMRHCSCARPSPPSCMGWNPRDAGARYIAARSTLEACRRSNDQNKPILIGGHASASEYPSSGTSGYQAKNNFCSDVWTLAHLRLRGTAVGQLTRVLATKVSCGLWGCQHRDKPGSSTNIGAPQDHQPDSSDVFPSVPSQPAFAASPSIRRRPWIESDLVEISNRRRARRPDCLHATNTLSWTKFASPVITCTRSLPLLI